MTKYRYPMQGHWLKGNTHIHSTVSDGYKTFDELAQMYHGAGYDFLFRTDHWAASDVHADPAQYPLLWLDGVELDGLDKTGAGYHMVGLGSFHGIERDMGLQQGMEAIRAQGGMLILAHPHWMGNTFEDALRWNFDGVEVYNHVCTWLNDKGDGGPYWSTMLTHNPNTLAFASDDAHIDPLDPGWNGGWVMVNAEECASAAILSAIRAGNYYSSCGPVIESIEYQDNTVSIQCSPVQFARLVGPTSRGRQLGSFDGARLTHFSFEVPQDWAYAYIDIQDERGRRAWTNPLWINE